MTSRVFYHVAGRAASRLILRSCPTRCCSNCRAGADASCASRIPRPTLTDSSTVLRALEQPCVIAFEPTGDYHRPLAYVLGQAGFHLCLVSSIAVARTREALYNSWDKNDPKDAQVILHLLKNGTTQRYLDPLITGHLDVQEMANTVSAGLPAEGPAAASPRHASFAVVLSRGRRYLHSSRAE